MLLPNFVAGKSQYETCFIFAIKHFEGDLNHREHLSKKIKIYIYELNQ